MKNILNTNEVIMNVNKLAKSRSKIVDVINASLGMLYLDNGELGEFSLITEELKKHVNPFSQEYDQIIGDDNFNDAVKRWIFNNSFVSEFVELGYTMGATGGLCFAFKNYINDSDKILIPSIRWKNYDSILNNLNLEYDEYSMFNIFNFQNKINNLYYQKSISVLINDPCHNPTGYCLSENEWETILDILSKESKIKKVTLILDLAYMDYCYYDYLKIMEKISYYLNDNFIVIGCYSFSKSLCLYGYRGGVCFILNNNISIREQFKKDIKQFARSTWSSPNHLLTSTLTDVLNKTNSIVEIKRYNTIFKEEIYNRAILFIELCKINLINIYPYLGGFFIFVRCNEPLKVFNRLIEEDIYVIPFENGLRISIASVPKNKIKRLVESLKTAVNS